MNPNNKRLAKNTIVLYFRMGIIMIVNLYMSRVILNTLGIKDYGIYNVVAGFVTMFTLLSGSLSNAIGRYITFELGRGDSEKLKRVFSASVTVQILISIIIGIILEIAGIWFLNSKMQIPEGRQFAANCTLQCSIFTFILNLISIPYNGCIIAHENMTAYSYISIFDVMLKLASTLLLYLNLPDKLIAYSVFLAVSALMIRIVYVVYCRKNFEECAYHFSLDKPLIKEMTGMASWNFFGSGGAVLNNQGVNVLINLFFGVTLNAARGIAMQVNSAVQQFAGSFITAINPQITKYYSVGDLDQMRKLLYRGIRYSFFLMFLIALPIFVEAPIILKIWLGNVPDYTVVFVRFTILLSLTTVLSNLLFTVVMATGKIRTYQIVVGSLSISVFFLTFIAYKFGANVTITYYISFIVDVIILFARLIIVNDVVYIGIKDFLSKVIARIVAVAMLSSLLPIYLYATMSNKLINAIFIIFSCFVSTLLFVAIIGLTKEERTKFLQIIKAKFAKSVY